MARKTRPGTQADAIRMLGYDPVALGGKEIDGEIYKPDTDPDAPGRCYECGRPGYWVSGAGRYLCAEHQDDY